MSIDKKKQALDLHQQWQGKMSFKSKVKITDREQLSLAYTPGVAEPCLAIEKDQSLARKYTGVGNIVAVITDGTAVLGLGDIGPVASMPVMEGKCALFSEFAGIDAVPICVDTKDVDEFVNTVYNISKSFGGINLEDISAPRCFEIERRLIEKCDIPVFHDDQHGTAIITSAGLLNALKVTGKEKGQVKIVISGAGSAGISIAKMILAMGIGKVTLCDRRGIVYKGDPENNSEQELMAEVTNLENQRGTLTDALVGADVLIGVSKPGLVKKEMISTMNTDSVVFAMANPVPEIMPDEAKAGGAKVVGTGRSDFPNQVNNVLAFPGIFRGALDSQARIISEDMKIAAAEAIASVIPEDELREDYVLPDPFDKRVVVAIREAIFQVVEKSRA